MGVDPFKKQQVPGQEKDAPLLKENLAGKPPPLAKAASPQASSPKKRGRAEKRGDRAKTLPVSVIVPEKTIVARNKQQRKPNCKPTGAGTTEAGASKEVAQNLRGN